MHTEQHVGDAFVTMIHYGLLGLGFLGVRTVNAEGGIRRELAA